MGSAQPTLWVPQEKALWLYQGVTNKGPLCESHLFMQHDRSEQGVGSISHLALWKGQASSLCHSPGKCLLALSFSTTCFPSRLVSGKRSSQCVGIANVEPWAHCYPVLPHAGPPCMHCPVQPWHGLAAHSLCRAVGTSSQSPELCSYGAGGLALLGSPLQPGSCPLCSLSPSSGPEHV